MAIIHPTEINSLVSKALRIRGADENNPAEWDAEVIHQCISAGRNGRELTIRADDSCAVDGVIESLGKNLLDFDGEPIRITRDSEEVAPGDGEPLLIGVTRTGIELAVWKSELGL